MLIRGGIAVAEGQETKKDFRIGQGIIQEEGPDLPPRKGEEILEVQGCYIFPGGIDAHTHFDAWVETDLKTSDDFYSGTLAAIAGGTTAILDFAEPQIEGTLADGLANWKKKAERRSFCDYGFHMTVPRFDETIPSEIRAMFNQGISSFKAYTAYQDGLGVTDKELYRIMECVKEKNGILCIHCENGGILEGRQEELKQIDPCDLRNHARSRPNLVEKEAVSRVLDMAALTGTKLLIVHVSTKEAMEAIIKARERGQTVYAETCPQYLLLDEGKYESVGFEGAKYIMSPPLRSVQDRRTLVELLKQGHIDLVSTDHCSFNYKGQKDRGKEDFTKIPNGIPSVEHRILLMLELAAKEGMPLSQIAALTSENPAKIYGMYPKKGALREGSDADILIIKSGITQEISACRQHQNVDYTPYEGVVINYQIQHVFLRGRWMMRHGCLADPWPEGMYIPRSM